MSPFLTRRRRTRHRHHQIQRKGDTSYELREAIFHVLIEPGMTCATGTRAMHRYEQEGITFVFAVAVQRIEKDNRGGVQIETGRICN
jgi:hypothetical protein